MNKVKLALGFISNKFLLGFGIIVVGLMLNACCAKRCPLSSCHQIKDHTHFFGAENDNNGAVAKREDVHKDLDAYSGVKWWRRVFKKKYKVEIKDENEKPLQPVVRKEVDLNGDTISVTEPMAKAPKGTYKTYKKFERASFSGKNKLQLEKFTLKSSVPDGTLNKKGK